MGWRRASRTTAPTSDVNGHVNEIYDLLRGELERHFDLAELKALSAELLGYSTDSFDSNEEKGPFARAIVERSVQDHAAEALADAIRIYRHETLPELDAVFATRWTKALAKGFELEGFVIEELLAEGSLGRVYRATHAEHGEVALKVIRSSLSRDESAVRRWLTTQRAFLRAKVPGVGTVHAVGMLASGQPWVATTLAKGTTLEARTIKSGAVHLREAWSILDKFLTALHELHEVGLVHSDVKPGNVFVDAEGEEVVLVDGGTYRLLAAGSSKPDSVGVLRVFGKAHGIAPEYARGESVTALSDVYSAAVVVYTVLTGRAPFDGESAFDVIAKHLESEAPAASTVAPLGFVSKAIDEVLTKALAKDPAKRYRSVRAFRDALETLARPEAVELDQKAFDKAKKALEKKASEANAAALEEIVESAHAWKEAVEVFSAVAEKAKDDEKKGLLHRAARIQAAELRDAEAAEKSYRALLALDATDAVARGGLEELRRAAGDYEGLAELLLEKAEHLEGRVERAAVLREIAKVYETKLADGENALVAWSQALCDDPDDERTVRAIERLAEGNAERWNEVLAHLTEAVAEPEDASDAVTLYCLMGRWYAKELSRPDFAVPCYAHAIQLDASCDPAYEGALALYRQAQSWQEYVQLLDQRAGAERNPVTARRYQAEAATVVREQLGNGDEAIARFRKILEEDPAQPEASVGLAEIYEEQKSWKELVAVLDERTRHATGEEKIKAMLELGEIYEDYLDDLEQATAHYEGALALAPGRLDTLKSLERVHARRNDYPELLAVLEKQLEAVATPRQRIAVLTHMGAIYEEEFVDLEKAIGAFEAVVEIDPGSEEANPALARLYKSAGRFDDLIVTLDRHAAASDDQPRRVDLTLKAARVLMANVGAPERALEHCERALALDPKNTEALELASKLRAQVGDVAAAVEAAEKLAEAAENASEKAAKYVEVGKILEEREDNDKAIAAYKRALDADEDNKPAADALRRLYAARGDAQGASELLILAIDKTEAKSQKAALYAELGGLYATRLKDDAKATEAFHAALGLDGTCTPALRGLGHMAYASGKYQEATMRLEPLLARSGEMEVADALQVAIECGDSLRRLGEHERAQTALFSAKALAPEDPTVLSKLAEASYYAGEFDDAADLYGELLEKVGEKLTPHERGEALLRLGEAHREVASYDKARDELLEAQKLLPGDERVLEALRQVHEKREDWKSVETIVRAQLDARRGTARVELLVALGDVRQHRLDDKTGAAEAYVEALEIEPEDRNLLSKLMGVYSESKEWEPLIEVILKIASLVDSGAQRAKYFLTAGSIFTHEIKDDAEAARYYRSALEADPTLTRAFDGLVRVLEKSEDWGGVAEAYEKQLARLADADAPVENRAQRYDELGELYRDRLGQPEKAADAFEAAQALDPDRRERLETLAEIYDDEPSEFRTQAVRTHRRLLQHSPFRTESYRALYDLLDDGGDADGAWCVAQTLRVLNQADPEVEAVYRDGRKSNALAAKGTLSADAWGLLRHGDVHTLLSEIFDVMAPAVLASQAQTLTTYDLTDADKRDSGDSAGVVVALRRVAKGAGISLPALYTRKGDPGGLGFLFTEKPAIGLGEAALADAPEKALAFIAGRHLAYYQGGTIMRRLVPSGSGLRTWVLAAVQLVTPGFVAPAAVADKVKTYRKALAEHLKSGPRDRLRGLVQRLLESQGEIDTTRWIATVDFTADRLGLLFADDLALAKAIIEATPEEHVSNQDRLRELYLFSVSAEYFELRKKLAAR